MVTALWRKAGLDEAELVYSGSILQLYPAIAEGLTACLSQALPRLRVVSPRGTAADGAVSLAMRLFAPVDGLTMERTNGRDPIIIRPMQSADVPRLTAIFNRSVQVGDIPCLPLTEKAFTEAMAGENGHVLAALDAHGTPVGFSSVCVEPGKPAGAWLTMLMVSVKSQRQGIGSALLRRAMKQARELGADCLQVSPTNPVSLGWTLPRTVHVEHNCMPGILQRSVGCRWLQRHGFETLGSLQVMYRPLQTWHPDDAALETECERMLTMGVRVGLWTPDCGTEIDTLCDHVGSEYWRHVLCSELRAHAENQPNADPALWPDGVRPQGPRPLIVAVAEGRIVGFTGPVDVQKNGRGWFTGICVDPDYGRRGIGRLMFRLLLRQLKAAGAAYVTLYTGEDNPARHIYEGEGLKRNSIFHIMRLPLQEAAPSTEEQA